MARARTAGVERGGMDVAMSERHWPSTQGKSDDHRDNRVAAERLQAEVLRRVPLSRILGGDREIVIEFNGADYRLRLTRNQKLILTK